MNQRLPLVLLLSAPLAAGCFLQPLDSGAREIAPESDAGRTTVTQTPPIEFDGGAYTIPCEVVTYQARAVLEQYCARCHSGRDEGAHRGVPPFDFLFDFEKLKTAASSVADLREMTKKMRFVAPGDPDNSRIYLRVSRGEMPPPDVVGLPANPRPTVSDISILREWISSCMGANAPVLPPPAAPVVDGGGKADGGGRRDAGGGRNPDGGRIDAPGGGGGLGAKIIVSGPGLMEGASIPLASSEPTNQSPALSWSNAPAQTRSYAVALTAVDGATVIWVLWDIPANVTQLPANLDRTSANPREVMGATQRNYLDGTGYIGPAASARAAARSYRIDVWALDVERLNTAGVGGIQGGARATQDLVDAIRMRAFPGTVGTINLRGNPGN